MIFCERCDDPGWIERDKLLAFEQVIGQPFVSRQLVTKVQDRAASVPILLFGSSGVGKLSLARLFARAWLCDAPLASGSPCQQCSHCKAADHGNEVACTEIDLMAGELAQRINSLVVDADGFTFLGDRRLTIVVNPQNVQLPLLDRFLKMLETHAHERVVFVCEQETNVSPAIRSRCERIIVPPLDEEACTMRLVAICQREELLYEDDALAMIALHSCRGAGELFHCLWSVARFGDVTLARTREALSADWAGSSHRAWMALLSASETDALRYLRLLSEEAPHALHRLRTYLQWVGFHFDGTPSTSIRIDPAFMFREPTDALEAIAAMKDRGNAKGQSAPEFWASAAMYWAECDADEWVAFDEYSRLFQMRISV